MPLIDLFIVERSDLVCGVAIKSESIFLPITESWLIKIGYRTSSSEDIMSIRPIPQQLSDVSNFIL